MEGKRKSPRVGKVVLRPSPTALKLMLIVLILFCTAALVALRWVHSGIQAETQSLLDEAAAIEHANSALEEKLGSLGSVQGIQDIAQEELGLVDPDAVIIDPE